MKILVDTMPNKKEECFFYGAERYQGRLLKEWCSLNGKSCSLKDEESIFGGRCRCLKVGITNI